MKVKVGDIVASEFGKGKVVVITKFWVIHETDDEGNSECAIFKDEWDSIWIPAKFDFDVT